MTTLKYPLTTTFLNQARLTLLNSSSFSSKPIWANNSHDNAIHPVFDDYLINPHSPDDVRISDEVDVTIYFCPQVRIEGVYYVTFGSLADLTGHKSDNTESIVENPQHWIKIAKDYLGEHNLGQISVHIKIPTHHGSKRHLGSHCHLQARILFHPSQTRLNTLFYPNPAKAGLFFYVLL